MEWQYHLWIDYEDDNGPGTAETDIVAVLPDGVVIVEVKLTGCRYGHEQLQGLYVPLLSHVFRRPARGLQICKAVTGDTPGPYVDGPQEFIGSELDIGTWHWPGR